MPITPMTVHTIPVNFDRPYAELRDEARLPAEYWTHVPKEGAIQRTGADDRQIALVTLSRDVRVGEALDRIVEEDTRFIGSGLWVRSAYLKRFPLYQNTGPILFPDEGQSLMQYSLGPGHVCFPSAHHDNGLAGVESEDPVTNMWKAGRYIAVLVRPGVRLYL